MNKSTMQRLAILEALLSPSALTVTVELPDGCLMEKDALEWWAQRKQYPLADLEHQENRRGLVVLLIFADMLDAGIAEAKAKGDDEQADQMTKERDSMLNLYFQAGQKRNETNNIGTPCRA